MLLHSVDTLPTTDTFDAIQLNAESIYHMVNIEIFKKENSIKHLIFKRRRRKIVLLTKWEITFQTRLLMNAIMLQL